MPASTSAIGRTTLLDTPCPRCGELRLVHLSLTDELGSFQHAYYVCTFYGSSRRASCGWSDWTVPGWNED